MAAALALKKKATKSVLELARALEHHLQDASVQPPGLPPAGLVREPVLAQRLARLAARGVERRLVERLGRWLRRSLRFVSRAWTGTFGLSG